MRKLVEIKNENGTLVFKKVGVYKPNKIVVNKIPLNATDSFTLKNDDNISISHSYNWKLKVNNSLFLFKNENNKNEVSFYLADNESTYVLLGDSFSSANKKIITMADYYKPKFIDINKKTSLKRLVRELGYNDSIIKDIKEKIIGEKGNIKNYKLEYFTDGVIDNLLPPKTSSYETATLDMISNAHYFIELKILPERIKIINIFVEHGYEGEIYKYLNKNITDKKDNFLNKLLFRK